MSQILSTPGMWCWMDLRPPSPCAPSSPPDYSERGHLHDVFTQMTHSLQELAAAQGECSGDGGGGRCGLRAPRRWMCVQIGSPAGVSDPEEVVLGSHASLVGVGEKG